MLSLSENLESSWKFLVRLFDDLGRTILLIVLQIIPIVNFIVLGYGYEIIRLGDTVDEPPPLENLGDLFLKGLKIFIISLVYFIVPLVIIVIILGPFLFFSQFYISYATSGLPLLLYSGIFFIAYAVSFLVGLGISIFAFMGIIHAVKCDELGKAFAFGEVLDLIKRVGWETCIPWALIMYLAISLILGISNWIIQSVLLALFIVFFARSAHYIYPSIKEEEQVE